MIEHRIVKDLIRKAYRRYLERFPGEFDFCSLKQGGMQQNPEWGGGVDPRAIGA